MLCDRGCFAKAVGHVSVFGGIVPKRIVVGGP
jgi:hypothetical protein